MPATFSCTLRTSDGPLFSGALRSLTLPTNTGEVEVLPGHCEAYIALVPGQAVAVTADGARRALTVGAGVFKIKDDAAFAVF